MNIQNIFIFEIPNIFGISKKYPYFCPLNVKNEKDPILYIIFISYIL